jgi:hypothetical protein
MTVESGKKKRKVITLDTKLDIIKRFDKWSKQGKHQQGARPQRVYGTTDSVQI